MEKNVFREIDSLEWQEYAAKAVKNFSRRVTAQKFYLDDLLSQDEIKDQIFSPQEGGET